METKEAMVFPWIKERRKVARGVEAVDVDIEALVELEEVDVETER
jgi:hypothetical protein